MQVTLYSKPGCPLCDELWEILSGVQAEFALSVVERNIEENAEDYERYRYLIPVLDIEGGELLYPPHHWEAVWNALDAVQRQTS